MHPEGQKAVCSTTFMVGYLDRKKKGMDDDVAIKESIKEAAKFAAKVCQMEGAFGHGKEVQIEALKTK